MVKIYWYISRLFASYFLYTAVGTILIFLIITHLQDIARNFEDLVFLREKFFEILSSIPTLTELLLPLVVLIASTLTFISLGNSNEIVILKSIGLSQWQMIQPLLFTCVLVSFSAYAVQSYMGQWLGSEYIHKSIWTKAGHTLLHIKSPIKSGKLLSQVDAYVFNDDFTLNERHHYRSVQEQEEYQVIQSSSHSFFVGRQLVSSVVRKNYSVPVKEFSYRFEYKPKNFLYVGFLPIFVEYLYRLEHQLQTRELLFAAFRKIALVFSVFVMIFLSAIFTFFNPRSVNFFGGFMLAILAGIIFVALDNMFANLIRINSVNILISSFGANILYLTVALTLLILRKN